MLNGEFCINHLQNTKKIKKNEITTKTTDETKPNTFILYNPFNMISFLKLITYKSLNLLNVFCLQLFLYPRYLVFFLHPLMIP